MPASTAKLLAALGASELSLPGATFAARTGGRCVIALEPLFPKRG